MRLRCFECGKSVSTEVDPETVIRAILICPECIERMSNELRLDLNTSRVKEKIRR